MSQKPQYDFIYLHDVPLYDQSSQDSYCGYYCAIMMLVAVDGGRTWRSWWKKELEPESDSTMYQQLEQEGVKTVALQNYLKDKGLETTLLRIKGTTEPEDTEGSDEAENPQEFCDRIITALSNGHPSILRLPHSFYHPYGHYVVVKGYINADGKEQFIVNDPLVGETSLWLSERKERCHPLKIKGDDKYGGIALLSLRPTCLFQKKMQIQASGEERPTSDP